MPSQKKTATPVTLLPSVRINLLSRYDLDDLEPDGKQIYNRLALILIAVACA
jgi:hypothetical protein